MHREQINFLVVTSTGFIVSASADGIMMWWKKKPDVGVEFVKLLVSPMRASPFRPLFFTFRILGFFIPFS